jgi:hypothetical protein
MKNFKLIEKTILFAIYIYLPVASLAQAGSLDLSLGDSGIGLQFSAAFCEFNNVHHICMYTKS